MQVSVEKTSELNRKMTIRVPEEMIQVKMAARIKSMAREVKLDGFRPGKVPQHVLKKMFGSRIRGEITGDLIQSSFLEALQEQKQRPVGTPNIVPVKQEDEGNGFEYTAEFEVYPEICLDGLDQIEIVRPTAVVEEADLDNMIEKLRNQSKGWNFVERLSQEQDRVTINFSGTCEGEDFTDGKKENFQVVIGSSQMIPGFEDNLIGLAVGSDKVFEVTFPEPYGNADLAGKNAQFAIEVLSVEEAVNPEDDADFIKVYGIEDGNMDSFREVLKGNMGLELNQALQGRTKNAVLNQLHEKIQLTLPKALIDQEIEKLKKPYLENAKKHNRKIEDLNSLEDGFDEQARRRVALALIMSEIIQINKIKVDSDRVRSTIEDMAKNYERPEDVVNYYYSDDSRLREVEQVVLEDMTVDWILGRVKVADQVVSFDEIMNREQ